MADYEELRRLLARAQVLGTLLEEARAEVSRLRECLETARNAERRARCPFALTLKESEHRANGCCE